MSEIGSNCVDTFNVQHSPNNSDSESDSDSYYTDEEDVTFEGTTIHVPENLQFKDIYLTICSFAKDNFFESLIKIERDRHYFKLYATQDFKTTTIGLLFGEKTRKLDINVHREVEQDVSCGAPSEQTPFTLICNAIHNLIANRSAPELV